MLQPLTVRISAKKARNYPTDNCVAKKQALQKIHIRPSERRFYVTTIYLSDSGVKGFGYNMRSVQRITAYNI